MLDALGTWILSGRPEIRATIVRSDFAGAYLITAIAKKLQPVVGKME